MSTPPDALETTPSAPSVPKPKAKRTPKPAPVLASEPSADPLDVFLRNAGRMNPQEALMLVFWKQRHTNPEFSIEIHPEDLKGFSDCLAYLEVTPVIKVYRPGGLPATQAIEAHGNRRAVPARAAIPPKNYVVIQMVDKDGNGWVPVENNIKDHEAAERTKRMVNAKEKAKQLANALISDLQQSITSTGTIQEAAAILQLLGSQ